jgi:hypothetical protein
MKLAVLVGKIKSEGLDSEGKRLAFAASVQLIAGQSTVATANILRALGSARFSKLAPHALVSGIGALISLAGNITVNGALTLTSGILNTGVYTVDLGTTGTIAEATPSATAPTSYVIGNVKATRNTGSTSGTVNFGGLGVELTETTKTNNSTEVIRTTGIGCVALTHTGITRYFTITPANDNALNGTMIFHYFDHEITGHTEANLDIYKSIDTRVTWTGYRPTRNAANNTLTLAAITSFSDWTASDGVNSFLPIKLVSFSQKQTTNGIQVSWITGTETNNDFFTIEQSTDGVTWERVTRVKGAGNSTQERTYSFTDTNPYEGIIYYRLKQTDFNGVFTYSDITSMNIQKTDTIQCVVYPTPASNSNCNIQIYAPQTGFYTIEITDIIGKVLFSKEIEITKTAENFNLSNECNFASSMYYLNILKNSKTVHSQKIAWRN